MSRPSPGDLTRLLDGERRLRFHDEIAQVDDALTRGDIDGAREIVATMRPDADDVFGFQDFMWSLEPDAYWRQDTWRRVVAIAAGPAVNLAFAVVLFTAVYLVAAGGSTTIARVLTGSPAAAADSHAGDRIASVAGQKVDAGNLSSRIRGTNGRAFKLRIVRNGRVVDIGPLHATRMDGVYRIGIEEKQGSGESLPAATRDSFRLSWDVVKTTVVGLGHLATGRDTNQVSGPVGIVRASAAGWRDGASTFLYVLGLISLALGLLNLLPLLPLDGGHIVMAAVEKVRGRTFPQAVYIRYSVIGLTLFMVLTYLGLRNDLFGG